MNYQVLYNPHAGNERGLEGTQKLISGGDGTLNRFINDTAGLDIRHDIYYFPAGSGNDFWKDLNRKPGDAPVCINEYLKDLPKVEIQGKSYAFLNGIGYGIDGYCCEKGDEHRQKRRRRVNYTAIALMVAHSLTALKALSLFPTMFKGEHVRYTQVVEMMTGQDITVEFDRPTPLQVDGETVRGVTSYHAVAASRPAAAVCV